MTSVSDLSTNIPNLTIIDSIQLDTLLPVDYQPALFSLFTDNKKSSKIEAYRVVLPKEKLSHHLSIYQWRSKTEFPIVKTKSVSIRNQQHKSVQLVELQILNEHCPIRLSDDLELNFGQALYLLKQSLIGFERLFNRFGGFQISENMIALNQKGHCKVWTNQNFSLNGFPKSIVSEKNMLDSIITIIEIHVGDSKNSRKFFTHLKTCSSFLEALKAIDLFIRKNKVLVPKKIITSNFFRPNHQVFPNFMQKFRLSRRSKASQTPLMRFSIKSSIPKKTSELQKLISKSPKKDQSPSSKIKRFKSENRLLLPSMMKTSEGETAYSRSIREIKSSNAGLSVQSPHSASFTNKTMTPLLPKPKKQFQTKWIEDSSFIMGGEQCSNQQEFKKQGKQKKELSQSEAFKQPYSSLRDVTERKYSANTAMKANKNMKKARNTNPENDDDYFAEFSSFLNREESHPLEGEEQEEQMQMEHLNKILKNNGWDIKGLLSDSNQLKQSFHAHDAEKDNQVIREDPRLEKLGSLGRRQMAMSILPEEMEDFA